MSDPAPPAKTYRVVAISMYHRDVAALAAKVAELKRRGWTKANKSALIRYALDHLDIDQIPIPPPCADDTADPG